MKHELFDLAKANAEVFYEQNKKTLQAMDKQELELIVNAPAVEQTDSGFLEYSAEKELIRRGN